MHRQIQREDIGTDMNLNVHTIRYMSGTDKRKIINN